MMLMKENYNIAKRVKKIVANAYDLPEDCISENDLFTNLGNSHETLQATMDLEKEFSCKITEDEAKAFKTVGDAINYMQIHF